MLFRLAKYASTDTSGGMKTLTVSKFARTVTAEQFAAQPGEVLPSRILEIPVPGAPDHHCFHSSAFVDGCRLHELFQRMGDNGPLSAMEKRYLPWMSALRTTLRDIGVKRFEAEHPLSRWKNIPAGVCDLHLTGGPTPEGVLELKVVRQLPSAPLAKDLVQIGAYATLADTYSYDRIWAALAYASISEAHIRLFIFEDIATLTGKAEGLFAAAA
jgi:hypothetical protein